MFIVTKNNHHVSWSKQTQDLRFCSWNTPVTGFATRSKAERAIRLSVDNGLGDLDEYNIRKVKQHD